jgi:hypothetical protein
MKLATCLLVPAVVLGLAACGSSGSDSTSQPSSSSAETRPAIAPIKQTPQQAEALRKASAEIQKATAKQQGKAGAAAGGKAQGGATTVRASKGTQLAKQVTAFAVGSRGLSVVAPSVQAGTPFQVALSSADGKVHKVIVGTPTPRTVTVPASGGTVVKFPSITAGKYSLSVDGKRSKPTLSVVAPRS